MNAISSPQPRAVPALIAEIIYLLCQTIQDRVRLGVVTPAGVEYIVRRLLGIRRRFRDLAARIEAGKIPRERTRAPRTPRVSDDDEQGPGMPRGWRRMKAKYAERKPAPLWRALGQTSGWLLRLAPQIPNFVHSAASCRARLEILLDDPEARALLMASRAVGDALRPLCWMLMIDVSKLYPVPAPAPAGANDAAAAREAMDPTGDAGRCASVAVSSRVASPADATRGAGPDAHHPEDFSKSA